MVSFKYRSGQSELMDVPDIPAMLLHKNLGELDRMNRNTGGHAISMEGIKRLMTDRQKIYHIVDLGCGSGDVLKYIAKWARANQYKVRLTGVDKNPDAIKYLEEHSSGFPEITGITDDYKYYLQTCSSVDVVHCSLFCHHLNDKELHDLFMCLKAYAAEGFVINDLHRNPIAYYGVWLITRILNGSSLSKHDGPVSVIRAFKRRELDKLLHRAGLKDFSIRWKWAFRYLVVAKTFK